MDFILAKNLKVGSTFFLSEIQAEVTVTQVSSDGNHVVIHYNFEEKPFVKIVDLEQDLPLTKQASEVVKTPVIKYNPITGEPLDTKKTIMQSKVVTNETSKTRESTADDIYIKNTKNLIAKEKRDRTYLLQSILSFLFVFVFFAPLVKIAGISLISISFNDINYTFIFTLAYIFSVGVIRLTSYGSKENIGKLYVYDLILMIIVTLVLFITAFSRIDYETNTTIGTAPFIALAAVLLYGSLFKKNS